MKRFSTISDPSGLDPELFFEPHPRVGPLQISVGSGKPPFDLRMEELEKVVEVEDWGLGN